MLSQLGLQTNVVLIVLFNYAYTFQQLDPKEMAEQLKRQGSSVQGIRPGKKTASYISETLNRMSLLGSGFLGLLAAAPAGVEALTKLQVSFCFPAYLLTPKPGCVMTLYDGFANGGIRHALCLEL